MLTRIFVSIGLLLILFTSPAAADDPNDVIPHEDRRELRGARILAAWLDHFDSREQNSMDSWMADRKDQPDSSPGHVIHYYLDTSDCLGSEWDWEVISRRLGHSYVFDWGDAGGAARRIERRDQAHRHRRRCDPNAVESPRLDRKSVV